MMFGPHNPHRGLGPVTGNNRLTELLDQIRAEFETQARSSGEYEQQFLSQVSEMETIRQKLQYLENNQIGIKQRYDEDVARLRQELENRGGVPSHLGGVNGLPPQGGSQPPVIGHGNNNLFGTIMTNPPGQGNPGLVPPQPQDHPGQHQGPQHQMPQPPPGMHQQPYPNYPQGPVNGYGGQNSQMMASPGPGKGRNVRGPSGPQVQGPPSQGPPSSQQPQPMGYSENTSPRMGRQTPPQRPPQGAIPDVGNQLADLDVELLPDSQKRVGSDWHAVFNPRLRQALDVGLLHTLDHESVVCCVRFSLDGRFIATGCNRVAQIFDVQSGQRVQKLEDASVEKDGDLYIRSVCFSPDGLYLATGAEDKQIRVWDIQARNIVQTFTGHEQDIYSLDYSKDGQYIASGSGDRTVRLWDLKTGREKMAFSIEDGVTTVAISPHGEFVAAGSLDKSVRVWDTRTGNLMERLDGPIEGHTDSVYSVAFAPDGRSLVSGSLDKTIKMWYLGDEPRHGPGRNKCLRTFEGHKDFVLSVALTRDGRWVLSGSKDRGVQFWNPNNGDTHMMLQGHKNSVISVAPSPTGELFATGSGDMRARIWRYSYV